MGNVKNEMIAKLEKRSKDWEQAKYDADDKIVELREEITKLEGYTESLADEQAERIKKMWRLQEHIDVLENNPFRRIYNWVTGIVKYRIKLVKIGDNK